MGTRGDHYISKCIFENNHGYKGGAINIEGNINSFQVTESIFKNNQASLKGGAISFAIHGSNLLFYFKIQ